MTNNNNMYYGYKTADHDRHMYASSAMYSGPNTHNEDKCKNCPDRLKAIVGKCYRFCFYVYDGTADGAVTPGDITQY